MSSAAGADRRLRSWLRHQVASLPPGAFSMVMATGILSIAAGELGLRALSLLFLVVAAAGYAVLCALTGWRLWAVPGRVLADARSPERAFELFTFVAGTNVLGLRLAASGWWPAAEALAVLAALAWLLLSYGLVAGLVAAGAGRGHGWRSVNGTWLVWVVGTQSVAGAAAIAARAHPPLAPTLALAAAALWAAGGVLYLMLITLVAGRLLLVEASPEGLWPAHWITMGATAISVLVAGDLLGVPRLPVDAGFVRDVGFTLWAFGTWWIPLLVVLEVWRYVVRRIPLRYQAGLWATVFPLGMYAAASRAYGAAAGLPQLEDVAAVEVWFGIAAWAITLAGMLAGWLDRLRGGSPGQAGL